MKYIAGMILALVPITLLGTNFVGTATVTKSNSATNGLKRSISMFSPSKTLLVVVDGATLQDEDEDQPFRASLQVAADEIAQKLDGPPKPITISDLVKLERPGDFPIGSTPEKYNEGRVLGFENQIWKLSARCIGYKLDDEGNLKLIMSNNQFEQELAVSPDLSHYDKDFQTSRYSSRIKQAHDKLMAYFHPQPSEDYKDCSVTLTVVGFGYYGNPILGNKCQNGASLTPILEVKIGNS